MKRSALAAVLLASLAAIPAPVQAHKGHARPQITRFEFLDRPLKAGAVERLVVVAHDPNSWISEIQVQWEDAEHSGGVIFAHTYCIQDPEFMTPGIPAKLKLDIEFPEATEYHLEARAISEKRCEGGNDTRISNTLERSLTVKSPTESFTDPDDASGSLDMLVVSHSQHIDQETFKTHLTHSVAVSEPFGAAPLSGGDRIDFEFDTDGDATTSERSLVVKTAPDGGLQANITDSSGRVLGEATVTVDGSTLAVDLPKRLLGRGLDRYRWMVATRDRSSSGCTDASCDDRAPDTGVLAHAL